MALEQILPVMRSLSSGQSGVALGCVLAISLLCAARADAATPARVLPIAGWLERARLSPGNVILEAKLDTGARTSSLDARNLQQFERDGRAWVAFDVTGNNEQTVRIERPLIRIASVKSALGADETRPTVALGVCVGNIYRVTEVTLVDRSILDKPLLIGRRFLRNRLLVDSSRRHLLELRCPLKTLR
jgi:hypothetical protein